MDQIANLGNPQPANFANNQPPINNKLYILLFVSGLIAAFSVGYILGAKMLNQNQNLADNIAASPTITPTITSAPSIITPTPQPTNTPIPNPTATPTPIIDEVKSIRKLIADFEKFNGVKNTAGALDFFTPPVSIEDKNKLSRIRSINLPYSIQRWFYNNDEADFLNYKTAYGYKVTMSETRDNVAKYLILEIVRVDDKFLIDRYYEANLANHSNESLKYQGFNL